MTLEQLAEAQRLAREWEAEVRKVLIQEGLAVRYDGGAKTKEWCE